MELPVCIYTGSGVCPNKEHCNAINKFYDDIVKSLHEAERQSVPRIPLKSVKPFCSTEQMNLKIKQFYGILCGLRTDGPLGGVGLFNELNLALNCYIRKQLSLNLEIMMKLIVIFLYKKPPEF